MMFGTLKGEAEAKGCRSYRGEFRVMDYLGIYIYIDLYVGIPKFDVSLRLLSNPMIVNEQSRSDTSCWNANDN